MTDCPIVRPAVAGDDRALAVLDATSWPAELQVVPPRPADHAFFGDARRWEDVLVAQPSDGDLLAGAQAVASLRARGEGRAAGQGARGLLGYAHLARHLPVATNAHVLHLNALVVAPGARGLGVGRALLAAAVAAARARGVRKLGLRVLSTNEAAIALYLSAGFVQEGRLVGELRLPDGSFADDLWLAKQLA